MRWLQVAQPGAGAAEGGAAGKRQVTSAWQDERKGGQSCELGTIVILQDSELRLRWQSELVVVIILENWSNFHVDI